MNAISRMKRRSKNYASDHCCCIYSRWSVNVCQKSAKQSVSSHEKVLYNKCRACCSLKFFSNYFLYFHLFYTLFNCVGMLYVSHFLTYRYPKRNFFSKIYFFLYTKSGEGFKNYATYTYIFSLIDENFVTKSTYFFTHLRILCIYEVIIMMWN